jgi:hypothetical protein
MEYFLGKWNVEGKTKANEFVPTGKATVTETYTLAPEGFWLERPS